MSIETGGDENHLGFERLKCGQPLLNDSLFGGGAAAAERQRYVDHIARGTVRAAVGIERMLEKTRHKDTILPLQRAEHIFGAVAMVDVEVDHRHALQTLFLQRISRRDGNIIDNTKTPQLSLHSLM